MRAALAPILPCSAAQTLVFSPDSMLWRICRERVTLLHGPAAAVLQVCHSRVAMGVREHSDFRNAPLARLRRTLDAVYAIAFATQADAQRVARKLGGVHARVRRDDASGGEGYSADEPELLLWVLATLIVAAVDGYERCVAPLRHEEKQQFYSEMRAFGEFFGLPSGHGPASWDEFVAYYDSMLADASVGSSEVSREVAWAVMKPARPWWLRATNPFTHFLFSEVLPAAVGERLGLRSILFSRAAMRAITFLSPRLVRWMPHRIRYCKEYRSALRSFSLPRYSGGGRGWGLFSEHRTASKLAGYTREWPPP